LIFWVANGLKLFWAPVNNDETLGLTQHDY